MYSMGPFSFLQRFLAVELKFIRNDDFPPSPVNVTVATHMRAARFLTAGLVVNVDRFDAFDEPLLIFRSSPIATGSFAFNFVFRGRLESLTGYMVASTRGSESFLVLSIWVKTVFSVISLLVFFDYNRAISGIVQWAASHPLNLNRLLCLAAIVANFPAGLLGYFSFGRVFQLGLALFGGAFRAILTGFFGIVRADHRSFLKVVGFFTIALFEFKADWVDHFKPELCLPWAILRLVSLFVYFGYGVFMQARGYYSAPIEQVLETLTISSRLIVATLYFLLPTDAQFVGNLMWENAVLLLLVASSFPLRPPLPASLEEAAMNSDSQGEELFLPAKEDFPRE
jgi:hypothetical protein